MNKKIWGLIATEQIIDGQKVWIIENIKRPFYMNDAYWIGINEKLLKLAKQSGASSIKVKVNNKWWSLEIKDINLDKFLQGKKDVGEFEVRKSKFEGGQDMVIYYFKVDEAKAKKIDMTDFEFLPY